MSEELCKIDQVDRYVFEISSVYLLGQNMKIHRIPKNVIYFSFKF